MTIVKLLTCLWTVTTLGGCGQKRAAHQDERPILPLVLSPAQPARARLDDPGCASAPVTIREIAGATIHAWQGASVVSEDVSLSDVRSQESLISPAISGTTYHDVYERTCDASRPPGHACDDEHGKERGWTPNDGESKGPLRLCRDGYAYTRLSYEGIALTSAYFLQEARNRYLELAVTAGAQAPDRIHLSVLPYFIDYYDNDLVDGAPKRLATFVTHNLAYFPGDKMIAVFPERADLQSSAAGFFWESAFILGHEYGHHIDFMRHGRLMNSIGLHWQPIRHDYVDDRATAWGDDSASTRAHVAGALAEGFADLMGYYASGGTNRSIAGVPGMGDDRDVGSAKFRSGDDKILTEDRLDALLRRTTPARFDGSPDYTDPHIAGAIIAHACDLVFADLTAAGQSNAHGTPDDVAARYRLALSFSDAIAAGLAALPDGTANGRVLDPIGVALQRIADQYLSGLSLTGAELAAVRSAVCSDVRTVIPALPSPPYANQGGC